MCCLLSVIFCIGFRCTVEWFNHHVLYKVFPPVFPDPRHRTVIVVLRTLHPRDWSVAANL